ncbi:uncharacterized protein ATNIH1004_005933 [Aspergillus tanneri]|uniref:Uncharacterized protein n=1 Tax=Aspergillus tanneri TaxID=1220188 RepID=A0A5M9MQL2_9EURO|nr:uncharacterized protein ATNIH1004_005933 [Aspergillus tanneri]KAA8647243.1 hypothetical protein ATNIH1004_005933 [Aspergillus tanneri]
MASAIMETIHEEIKKFQAVVKDVAKTGTWLYPFKGLIYLSYHQSLWRPFLSRTWQTITLGIGITAGMFFFTYIPQATILTLTSGPFGPISAILLIISESATLTTSVARMFSLRDALTDTFDATLVTRGMEPLVSEGRHVLPASTGRDAVARLGKMLKQPLERLNPRAVLRSFLLLPLNLIPVVGTLI